MSGSTSTDSSPVTAGHSCYQLDPTRDPRWARLVATHHKASVFHSVPWLLALERTYGYEPVVFTTSSADEELKNGIVFCHVHSWLTGRRLVSLPFSDHCEPLCDTAWERRLLIQHLQSVLPDQNWKYIEIRPVTDDLTSTSGELKLLPSSTYFFHSLDLNPDLQTLFRELNKDSVQRRIQRAERAGLFEKTGRSEDLIKDFYKLYLLTRARQRVPPAPYAWFKNVADCLDAAAELRVAYAEAKPIAAILTMRFKNVVYYKYGCSDARFNRFGATPWLFWNAIVSAKSNGAEQFDMGRTDEDHRGLLAFKNHWVPRPQRLVYWRYPARALPASRNDWTGKLARKAGSFVPTTLLETAGRLMYRHFG
jgi:hypothetical protein